MDKTVFRPNKKSNWTPPKTPHVIETFITAVNNDLSESEIRKIPKDNLTKEERKALEELKARTDIIITKADKGGAVVIWDTNDYIKEAERQLNDTTSYKVLAQDPTEENTKKVKNLIQQFKEQELIDDKLASNLIPENVKTPRFYLLPKVHKVNNPGRPVISSVSCHTSEISRFIDHHLQENVKQLKSYVKDTNDFINKIENLPPVPKGSYLISMDVRSLYTNIPHKEGINAIKQSLGKRPAKVSSVIILMFLNLILTLNNFVFNGINYLQTKGCAMGTKCAPCYANLFMGWFEEKFIYKKIKKFSNTYLRYIDDIFLIWNGTKEQFENFIKELNNAHPTIKFDYEISQTEVNFLDTTVYIDKQNTLRTKLYRKPTDRQNYLHIKSEHPPSLKRSIPYSQALRLRKICYEEEDLRKSCKNLVETFVKRGYQEEKVIEQVNKAIKIPRTDLLKEKDTKKITQQRIPLVIPYNRTNPPVKDIIMKHWNILQIDRNISDSFKDQPILAFKRNKNLRDIIGSNNIVDNQKIPHQQRKPMKGTCQPCLGRSGNLCCKQIKNTSTFTSDNTGKTYNIFHKVNCKSTNVIYLMECSLCKGKQYVGKSEWSVNRRINLHRNDVWRIEGPPCDKHFQLPGHEFNKHAKFTVIEKIENPPQDKLKIRSILEHKEDKWMLRLNTITPHGLNIGLNYPQDTTGSLY